MARDRRFVAVHRGGSLDPARHRLLAQWAADCAEHVLPLFTRVRPDDDRPRRAIETGRAWARGEATVGEAREAAYAAHAAAREATNAAATATARAAGQAVSVAHMADHSLGPVMYGVKAAKLAAAPDDADEAGRREYAWQLEQLPAEVRDLVLAALEEQTVLGDWKP